MTLITDTTPPYLNIHPPWHYQDPFGSHWHCFFLWLTIRDALAIEGDVSVHYITI